MSDSIDFFFQRMVSGVYVTSSLVIVVCVCSFVCFSVLGLSGFVHLSSRKRRYL